MVDIEKLKNDSEKQLRALTPELMALFTSDSLSLNYTLIARPNTETVAKLTALTHELRLLEPNLFYYPADRFHMTLIGELPVTLDAEQIIGATKDSLPSEAMQFDLIRVASNPHAASVTAVPINFDLHEFRETMRSTLGVHGTDYTEHLAFYEYVGWINFMRYPVRPSQQFLDTLFSMRNRDFGTMSVSHIELYKNESRILDPAKSELIYRF